MKILSILILLGYSLTSCPQSIQEKLGYPKDATLLIVHADDLGVSHSENRASFEALEYGSVKSASILVPCPWFNEVAAYAAANPKADLGIHLALTSEWRLLKWGSVSDPSTVSSLHDPKGFFYDNSEDVYKHVKIDQARKELKAQIEKALLFGIDITHLDSHMGTLFSHPGLFKLYLELGKEYKVPVLLMKDMLAAHKVDEKTYSGVFVNSIIVASPQDFEKGMPQFYNAQLKSLQPGLHCLLLHAAYNDDEMKAVTINHKDYGSEWRQDDFDYWTSDECKALLKEKNIYLVTWREIRDKLYR